MRGNEDMKDIVIRCKDCNCVITINDTPLLNRTGYYCQGCGEDKQVYETYESEEMLYFN